MIPVPLSEGLHLVLKLLSRFESLVSQTRHVHEKVEILQYLFDFLVGHTLELVTTRSDLKVQIRISLDLIFPTYPAIYALEEYRNC